MSTGVTKRQEQHVQKLVSENDQNQRTHHWGSLRNFVGRIYRVDEGYHCFARVRVLLGSVLEGTAI